MRAVKSVITAAGNLKREFPDADEDVLLLRYAGLTAICGIRSFSRPLSDLFTGPSETSTTPSSWPTTCLSLMVSSRTFSPASGCQRWVGSGLEAITCPNSNNWETQLETSHILRCISTGGLRGPLWRSVRGLQGHGHPDGHLVPGQGASVSPASSGPPAPISRPAAPPPRSSSCTRPPLCATA